MSKQHRRTSYPTDRTDAEWQRIAPDLPERMSPRGRCRVHAYREILNAICSVLRSGCAWRMLPHNLPPWKTVYHYFRLWQRDGSWVRVHAALRTEIQGAAGQSAEPSAAILDSRSVNTTENGGLGVECWQNRPRTHTPSVGGYRGRGVDRGGACRRYPRPVWGRLVVGNAHGKRSHVRLLWVDGGNAGQVVEWAQHVDGWTLDSSKRPNWSSRFQVVPKRWGWNGRLPGWGSIAACVRTTAHAPIPAKRSWMLP